MDTDELLIAAVRVGLSVLHFLTIKAMVVELKKRDATQAEHELDKDGWIEWHGGDCPVGEDVWVHYRWRDGTTGFTHAGWLSWPHEQADWDIVAYKIMEQGE